MPQSSRLAAGLGFDRPSADKARHCSPRLASEQDVLRDREFRQQAQLLVYERDAAPARLSRGRQADRLPLDRDLAAVVRKKSGEDAHQRRLAGAVLPDQAVRFAGDEIEVDAVDSARGAETLCDSPQTDGGSEDLARRGPVLLKGNRRSHASSPQVGISEAS